MKIFLFIILSMMPFIFCEEIYYYAAPDGAAYINGDGSRVIGPITPISEPEAKPFNVEFNGIPVAVISNKNDGKYHLLSSNGEWLYASQNILRPASKNRVWESVSKNVWRLLDFSGNEYYRIEIPHNITLTPHALGYFSNGIAIVNTQDGCMFLRDDGTVLDMVPLHFSGRFWNTKINYIDQGVFVGEDINQSMNSPRRYALFDNNGSILTDFEEYDDVGIVSEGMVFAGYGYIDLNGNRTKAGKGYRYGYEFTEGLAAVVKGGDRPYDNYYFSYIDKEGNEIVPAEKIKAVDARPFSEGLAAVSIGLPDTNDPISPYRSEPSKGPWGAIDRNGNWIIEPKYPVPFRFDRGLALVKVQYSFTHDYAKMFKRDSFTGERYIYINKNDEIIFDSLDYVIANPPVDGFKVLDSGFEIDR